jgi:hypothetical protein
MFIASNKDGDGIFGLFEKGVLEVSVGFSKGEIGGSIVFTHVLEPKLIEVRHVVIHLTGEFISESHEFENLSADNTSLKWALSEHQPHKFVRFIIVFVLRSCASNISEWSVSSKYN